MALAYQHGPWWLTRFQANTWPSVATGATDIYSTLIAVDLWMHATQTSMVPDVTMPCVTNRPPTSAVFLSLSLLSFCLSPQNITVYFLFLFHFFVIYLPLIMGPTCSVMRGAGTQVSLPKWKCIRVSFHQSRVFTQILSLFVIFLCYPHPFLGHQQIRIKVTINFDSDFIIYFKECAKIFLQILF